MSMTEVFTLNYGGQQVWKAVVDGKVIAAEFNTRGAALAAIEVERRRKNDHRRILETGNIQATSTV